MRTSLNRGGTDTVIELCGDEIATLRVDRDEAERRCEALKVALDRVTEERDGLLWQVDKGLSALAQALGAPVVRDNGRALVATTIAVAIERVEALEKQRDEANQSLQGLVEDLADATRVSKAVVCGLRPGDEARALVEVVRKAFAKPKR